MPRLPRLPDLLTTANLCCGVASILLASQGQLTIACGLIFLAALFDVLDGLAARALGGGSEFGKQLDSLADMVSFGVAPAYILWSVGMMPLGDRTAFLQLMRGCMNNDLCMSIERIAGPYGGSIFLYLAPMFGALTLVVCSAWRLAKFNVSTEQRHGFLGLATPANALFWASIPLAISKSWAPLDPLGCVSCYVFISPFFGFGAIFVPIVLGILMLSNIPLPSLKFKHMNWKGNEVMFILIAIGASLISLYGFLAVPLILILYLLSPLWGKLFPKPSS